MIKLKWTKVPPNKHFYLKLRLEKSLCNNTLRFACVNTKWRRDISLTDLSATFKLRQFSQRHFGKIRLKRLDHKDISNFSNLTKVRTWSTLI